jgi:hypothetical protein
MNQQLIFIPVLMQVFLTFLVYIGITVVKNKAIASGEVDESRRALHKDAWPDSVLKFTNNLTNQFEAPTLFFVLCFVIWATDSVNIFSLTLAWVFTVSRYIHAYVHTGSNYVPLRKRLFMFGVAILLVLFVYALLAVIG